MHYMPRLYLPELHVGAPRASLTLHAFSCRVPEPGRPAVLHSRVRGGSSSSSGCGSNSTLLTYCYYRAGRSAPSVAEI